MLVFWGTVLAAWADEPLDVEEANATEFVETVDDSIIEPEVGEQAVGVDEPGAAKVPVTLKLTNGVVLVGEMEIRQVLYWTPSGEGTVDFYLSQGGLQSIQNSLIADILQGHQDVQADTDTNTNTNMVEKEPSPQEAQSEKPSNIESGYEGKFSFANPAASRYLYAPSSIPLQKEQGYVSQKLLFTSAVYGVTDNVTLLMGTMVPIPFLSVVGGKYARRINDKWHVGAGAEAFFNPFAGSFDAPSVPLSIGFVSATYGDLDSHVTVATGAMYEQLFSDGNITHPVFLSGHKRVSDRLALVSENWVLLNPDALGEQRFPYMGSITSVAFRLVGRRDKTYQILGQMVTDNGYPRYTWDFGLVMLSIADSATLTDPLSGTTHYSIFSESFNFGPIPWIDYTWHFGPARRAE